MPLLLYRARTIDGEEISGRVSAPSEREARSQLVADGLQVLELRPPDAGLAAWLERATKPASPRIKIAALANITSQFSLMLRTGTPLVETLDALARQSNDPRAYDVLTGIKNEVSAGTTLAGALSRFPKTFSRFYVSAVRAGEATGTLPAVFARLEADLKKQLEVRAAVTTALVYPLVVGCLAIGAVVFLMTYVLPRFIVIFQKNNVALPLPTQILLNLSGFLVNYWPGVLAVAIAAAIGLRLLLYSAPGASFYDSVILRVPVVGGLVRMLQTANILRTLGTLLSSGVPLVDALEVAHQSASNRRYQELVQNVSRAVTQGEEMWAAFARSALLTPSVKQMITTGERTGSLAIVMNAVADHLDADAERQLKKLGTILEPLMIMVLGLLVGFIAVSVLWPLFQLTRAVRGG